MRVAFVANEVGIGLWRNLSMTVSVVLVTAVSLTFFGAGLLFQRQVDLLKDYWYDRVQVSMFLCGAESESASCAAGDVTDQQKEVIEADLGGPELAPYVEQWFYESQQEAYDRFVEQFADSAIVENVTVEQLPESYRIRLADPSQTDIVVAYFAGRTGVEEVDDQRDLLDGLFRFLDGARWTAWFIAGFLLLASALLVWTTIRLAAFNRRRETGIMRLVGASKFFIQLPFMLEGIAAACLGAIIATGLLLTGERLLVQGYLAERVRVADYIGPADVFAIAPAMFAVGVVLAAAASLLSLQRYLKV
ncbi:MAG: permease-like cell division protein FtsX [Kineosporiaceae bacterium]